MSGGQGDNDDDDGEQHRAGDLDLLGSLVQRGPAIVATNRGASAVTGVGGAIGGAMGGAIGGAGSRHGSPSGSGGGARSPASASGGYRAPKQVVTIRGDTRRGGTVFAASGDWIGQNKKTEVVVRSESTEH